MPTAAKIVVFILVLIAFGMWVFEIHPNLAVASVPSVSLVQLEPRILASETTVLPNFQATGVLIYDIASGAPGTPYLVYLNPKGELFTKQLILTNGRVCDVSAGDLPCVGIEDNTPDIPAGTVLAVTGGQESQGVFADTYKVTSIPSDMVVFTAVVNQPVTLSNGASVTFLGTADDASCTLGEGCFGDGVTRAAVQMSMGNGAKTIQMVPGSLHEFGNTTFVVLSINGKGDHVRVSMLAVATK